CATSGLSLFDYW
nr:immunoglobulin heavy chain junction region [Macaca mulatta]MOY30480.1 immunoglobulin heavy chain junction region [Macaca mulatta]